MCYNYVDFIHRRYLACALILRGKVSISDIRKNIERYSTQYNMWLVCKFFVIMVREFPILTSYL